jgi:uncharacterized membrane protein
VEFGIILSGTEICRRLYKPIPNVENVMESRWFIIILMSMTPVIELKGSIITGLAMGYPLWEVFIVSWFFSSLPAPFIIVLLKPLMHRIKSLPRIRDFIDRCVRNSMKKASVIKKYSLLGLFIFVAIPLPGTGIWSGSVVSSILGLDLKHAVGIVFAANLVAGIAILTIFNGIFKIIT